MSSPQSFYRGALAKPCGEMKMSINLVVADDDIYVLKLVNRAFGHFMPQITSRDYTVATAQSGIEARDLIIDLEPRFALLDTQMQDHLRGYDVCAAARAYYNGSVYIVGMSGEDCSESWSAAGANNFLRKPFEMGELRLELERALKQ